MKIAVVHNEVSADDAPDAKDVIMQVEAVTTALRSLGYRVAHLECTLNLEDFALKVNELKPQLVFNLVESLGGQGSLIHLFPFLLEGLAIPYTGSKAEAIRLTSNKIAAKQHMREAGLPTPDWVGFLPGGKDEGRENVVGRGRTWIIKSLWEHASIGLDGNSILEADNVTTLVKEMDRRSSLLGGPCFAEEFIAGREFNLSLLAGDRGPTVMPPAEICFDGFEPDKPRIVDYRAKWDEDSFEYQNTPRRFDFNDNDGALIEKLRELALHCWEVFGLKGYARVDFRVDEANKPWILEVNANPCLSPDAGFSAALSQAGVSFKDAVQAIVTDAGCIR